MIRETGFRRQYRQLAWNNQAKNTECDLRDDVSASGNSSVEGCSSDGNEGKNEAAYSTSDELECSEEEDDFT